MHPGAALSSCAGSLLDVLPPQLWLTAIWLTSPAAAAAAASLRQQEL
jgi:hypothetical protein